MIHKLRGDENPTTIVCIDSYQSDVPTGRFYNPHLSPGQNFHGLIQLLQGMEQALESQSQETQAVIQSFSPPPMLPTAHPGRSGEVATFAVRILFRQNVSWQGCITWLEGRQEQSFRSVLELVQLMRRVLSQEMSA